MQVVQYEDGLAGIGEFLTKLLVTIFFRLECGEVGRIKVNPDNAYIALDHHAAAGLQRRGRYHCQTDTQQSTV